MADRHSLLCCLMAADFAAHETRLYLDTHPCDEAAMSAMKEYAAQAAALREEYERSYGPLTAVPGMTDNGCWIDDPWPWNYCFHEGRCQ